MNFDRLLPSIFKALLKDPAYSLERRFDEHNIRAFSVVWVGDHNSLQHLVLDGRNWKDDAKQGKATEACVAMVTPRSMLVDIIETPTTLPGGNTESAIAQALADKPQQFLKKNYDPDRAYHCLPLDGRRILAFTVRAADITKLEADVSRSKLTLVHAFCGMAVATKYAFKEHADKYMDANALVVVDQNLALTISFKDGKVEAATPLSISMDDAGSLNDLRKHIKKFVRNTSDLSQKGKAIVFVTHKSALTSLDAIASPDYDAELVHISTSALCFV